MFVFFKIKTAYELRIGDWSSDVCSSDLLVVIELLAARAVVRIIGIVAVAVGEAGGEHRVVEDAFQPVAILRLAGERRQIARQLHVGEAAARRLEMRLGGDRTSVA